VEHHVALSNHLSGHEHGIGEGEPHVGIIFTGLNVKRSIGKCAKLLKERPIGMEDYWGDCAHIKGSPEVVIEGHADTKFPYIREHLECVVSRIHDMSN
jgi:pyruvate dehydrogenase kinase 2/3/4